MTRRWLTGLAVFLLTGTLLLPQAAADIDYFFSGQTDRITWEPLAGWAAVLAGGKALQFYFILAAGVVLFLAWILFTGSYLNYKSAMHTVTPDISTPCAAGQGQYGTARWLDPADLSRYFARWRVNERGKISELLQAGARDKEEIKHADIQID